MIQQSHSWAYIPEKATIQKDTHTPMFIAATINSSQDVEANYTFINRRMDKDNMDHGTYKQLNTTKPLKKKKNK